MDWISQSEIQLMIGIAESSGFFGDPQRFYIWIFSSLLHFPWRRWRFMVIIVDSDLIGNYRGFVCLSISLLWQLELYKGIDRAMNHSLCSSFLLVSFFSLLWSFLFSGFCGCFFFGVRMSQSSLLGKESVEKSLGSVVSKMRIKIPKFDNSALIKGYAKTMIGRCMNPRSQDMKGLLLMFPRICHVEGRVAGADIGLGRFQLDFDEEEDIAEVLKMEPFHFDGWMVSLVRWKPSVDPAYPSTLTFWIQVLGIPIEYWAEPFLEAVGDALGKVVGVDIDLGRVKVIVDGFKPLVFETTIEFDDGEETLVSLRYERLYGYCSYCFSMCHDVEVCEKKNGRQRSLPQALESGDGAGSHHWSYKGAVAQGRQPHIGKDGKGKGIAVERGREEGKNVHPLLGKEGTGKALAEGSNGTEERKFPNTSQTFGQEKGNQSRFLQGEGSSRSKRFTNYAQFNDHRFHEKKKLKAKAKEATKVKVVESTEIQAVQTQAFKPKKIVRKSLVFEDETGGSAEQYKDHKELSGTENHQAVTVVESPTDLLVAQTGLEQGELNQDMAEADTELGLPHSEEGIMADGDSELVVDADNMSVSEADVFDQVEETLGSVEGDDNLMDSADQGTRVNDKGKGKEGPLGKKKTGRGIILPGVTTRKRIVQALVSPRKRPAPKNGSNTGDNKFPPAQGPEKGGPGGSQPLNPTA